jgi:hypothetical protein
VDAIYVVYFGVVGTDVKYVDRTLAVSLKEGYSTFEDIRKILAIQLGLKAENIKVKSLALLED